MDLKVLEGKVAISIEGLDEFSYEVYINTACGKRYKFYHEQDCCENVCLVDFEGDPKDFENALIVEASESSKYAEEDEISEDSGTWTFYNIQTTKGSLWMRWLGESSGYYSESVDFIEC